MSNPVNNQDQEEKFKAFFEKARRGVLAHLQKQGGVLSMADLHDYSLKTYLIQHQRFSIMMESFVNDKLVTFDDATATVFITDQGALYASNPN